MRWSVLAGLIMVVTGCAVDTARVPKPTEEMAMAMGVRQAELARGHATYLEHCNQCHERIPPGKIDPENWRGIVPHMAVRAHIDAEEERDLLLYVMAAHGTVHGLDLEH